MLEIKTVTVIGANGTMGSLVAGIISSFGDAKVYLVSRNKQDSINVIDSIKKSVRSDVIENNLIPVDYSQLKECAEQSDWIYESIKEDFDIKLNLYKKIDSFNIENTIISTGTSGLSINELAENLSEKNRKRFLGTHFFNPPYNLNLCEIITSKYTDNGLVEELNNYLTNVLCRNCVIVEDTPAFLANRIGFHFLNETLQLAEKYKDKGGVDYIDSLLCGYTGRIMKPLKTVDFVGLDVHKAIVDNVYNNIEDEFKNDFKIPEFAKDLINSGKLGRKTNAGLYRKITIDGIEKNQVYDIIDKKYRDIKKYKNKEIEDITNYIKIGKYEEAYKTLTDDNSEEMNLVTELLTKYIVYSLIISSKYAKKLNDCDNAMSSGFNWCPPIAMKELFKKNGTIKEQIDKYIDKKIIEEYKVYDLIEKSETKYDCKKYLKAIY